MRFFFLVVCFLIAYGSLFPFRFEAIDLGAEIRAHLFTDWMAGTGLGDSLGNIALFLPYGFFGALVFERRWPRGTALALVAVTGLALAVLCQFAQIYIPRRTPSVIDVLWNGAGILIGMAAALRPEAREALGVGGHRPRLSGPVLLIALWAGAQLAPFLPGPNWRTLRHGIEPLLSTVSVSWPHALFLGLAWTGVARLGQDVVAGGRRRHFLPLMLGLVLILKIIIIGRAVTPEDIIGGIAAVILWPVLRGGGRRLDLGIGLALLVGFALTGLAPYMVRQSPGHFEWIPFGGALIGSMTVNVQALLLKLFVLATTYWLLTNAGWRYRALILVTTVEGLVETAQIWLPGRTAEVTDILLALVIGIPLCLRRGKASL